MSEGNFMKEKPAVGKILSISLSCRFGEPAMENLGPSFGSYDSRLWKHEGMTWGPISPFHR